LIFQKKRHEKIPWRGKNKKPWDLPPTVGIYFGNYVDRSLWTRHHQHILSIIFASIITIFPPDSFSYRNTARLDCQAEECKIESSVCRPGLFCYHHGIAVWVCDQNPVCLFNQWLSQICS